MVDSLKSIFGFENLNKNQIQSKLDAIISKHPYFHLAQLYRLGLNKTQSPNQKGLFQTAVSTYQRVLLKHWLQRERDQVNNPSITKNESVKPKSIDDLIDIPESSKVVRAYPNPSAYGKTDLSKKPLVHYNEVYTETLANLYLKQFQYQKAIEVLSFLKSVDSKKSDYFACRIREIQKQQKESDLNT